jgi:heme/copper-type cytochrome/quinol oxidase subunit 4
MAQANDYGSEGTGKYLVTYVIILAIAALQFVIAYSQADIQTKFVRMFILAFVEGAVGVLFFMHLWSENKMMRFFVALFVLFVLAAMQYGWPDSFRIAHGAPFSSYH